MAGFFFRAIENVMQCDSVRVTAEIGLFGQRESDFKCGEELYDLEAKMSSNASRSSARCSHEATKNDVAQRHVELADSSRSC